MRFYSILFSIALVMFPNFAQGRVSSVGKVGTTFSDGVRFFFNVESATYCGGHNRFVLRPTDPRLSLVLLAKASSKTVTILAEDACINDGDTEVVIVYVHS